MEGETRIARPSWFLVSWMMMASSAFDRGQASGIRRHIRSITEHRPDDPANFKLPSLTADFALTLVAGFAANRMRELPQGSAPRLGRTLCRPWGESMQADGDTVTAELFDPLIQVPGLRRPAVHGRGQLGAHEAHPAVKRADPLGRG